MMINVPNEPEPEIVYQEPESVYVSPEPRTEDQPHREIALGILNAAGPGLAELLVKVAGGLVEGLMNGQGPFPRRSGPDPAAVIEHIPLPEGIKPPIGFVPPRTAAALPAPIVPAAPQTLSPQPVQQGDVEMNQENKPLETQEIYERVSRQEIANALQDIYAAADQFGLGKTVGEAIALARMFEGEIVETVYEKIQSGEYRGYYESLDYIESDFESEPEPDVIQVPNGEC